MHRLHLGNVIQDLRGDLPDQIAVRGGYPAYQVSQEGLLGEVRVKMKKRVNRHASDVTTKKKKTKK